MFDAEPSFEFLLQGVDDDILPLLELVAEVVALAWLAEELLREVVRVPLNGVAAEPSPV